MSVLDPADRERLLRRILGDENVPRPWIEDHWRTGSKCTRCGALLADQSQPGLTDFELLHSLCDLGDQR